MKYLTNVITIFVSLVVIVVIIIAVFIGKSIGNFEEEIRISGNKGTISIPQDRLNKIKNSIASEIEEDAKITTISERYYSDEDINFLKKMKSEIASTLNTLTNDNQKYADSSNNRITIYWTPDQHFELHKKAESYAIKYRDFLKTKAATVVRK